MNQRALCVSHRSAVELWRSARRALALENGPGLLVDLLFDESPIVRTGALPASTDLCRAPSRPDPGRVRAARAACGTPIMARVDYLVSAQAGREHLRGARPHLCEGAYPEGTFRAAREGVLVTGPELTLVQMAPFLDDVALLELASELMGFFVLDPSSQTGLRHAPPLLTAEGLGRWLAATRELRAAEGRRMPRGTDRLLSLLDHVPGRAASPGEVRTVLVLSAPVPMGGYGLRMPELNVVTGLSAADAETYGVEGYVCDLTWRDARTVAEYRGELVHKQRAARVSDARKGNVLSHLGYEVIVVEREQLNTLRLTDELASLVADRLGTRLETPGPDGMAARLDFRRRLLGRWV